MMEQYSATYPTPSSCCSECAAATASARISRFLDTVIIAVSIFAILIQILSLRLLE